MDLMEYQAKELFAKHGVATTLGVVVTTAPRRWSLPVVIVVRMVTVWPSDSFGNSASGTKKRTLMLPLKLRALNTLNPKNYACFLER